MQEIACRDKLMITNPKLDLRIVDNIRKLRVKIGTIFIEDQCIYDIVGEENLRWNQYDEELMYKLIQIDQVRRNIIWALGDFANTRASKERIRAVSPYRKVKFQSINPWIEKIIKPKNQSTPYPKEYRKQSTNPSGNKLEREINKPTEVRYIRPRR